MKYIRIGYLNVAFDLIIRTEDDKFLVSYLVTQIQNGKQFQMRDLAKWCTMHRIEYKTFFKYRKDYPVIANLWNLYSYVRFNITKDKLVQDFT